MERLDELREYGGGRQTEGIPPEAILRFLELDERLGEAIDRGLAEHRALRREWETELRLPEAELCQRLQKGLLNFYEPQAVCPFVPLAGSGPWVVTSHGAVIHDSGGYGMLGLGHAPPSVLDAMAAPYVMANVMTPSLSQQRVDRLLRAEIGRSRGGCPFSRFLWMNSGSEAVAVAARICDLSSRALTDPGGRHAGKPIKLLALRGGFHGRTQRPALASSSTRPKYAAHLASFRDRDNLRMVDPNDVEGLRQAFAQADAAGEFLEAFFMEPVMGEGNPGLAITPGFYDAARALTREHGALLLVDSIQAGLRAHGCLSIVDYPGFGASEAPDMETYSKALNAGQFPLSVLALREEAAALYVRGVYGNTMTTNPRALEVACAVLEQVDESLRENIRARGAELLEKLRALAREHPGAITHVQGTGLLLSAALDPDRYKVVGSGGVEEFCRLRGVGVIHGGANALRFTPHFRITSAELDLMLDVVGQALRECTLG